MLDSPIMTTSLWRAAAVGAAAALVLVASTYGLAALLADDLVVTPPGRPTTTVSLPIALAATLFGVLLALAGAALAGRTPRPRTVFLVLAGVALVGSFASPVGAAESATTAFWLCALHVAVAAGAVPPLARALRATR